MHFRTNSFTNAPLKKGHLEDGAYQGEISFIEPMVTTEMLDGSPDITAPVPQPEAVQQSGFYPTRYHIVHDETAGEHRVTLANLTRREASS